MEGGRWSHHKIKEEVIIRSQGPKSFKSISGLNSKRLSVELQWAEAEGFLCRNQSFGKAETVCIAHSIVYKSCGRTSTFRANRTPSRWIIWWRVRPVSLHQAKAFCPLEKWMNEWMNGTLVFGGVLEWLQRPGWPLLWTRWSWDFSYQVKREVRSLNWTSGNSTKMDCCVCSQCRSKSEYKIEKMLFCSFQTNDFVLFPSPPRFISSSITSARGQSE